MDHGAMKLAAWLDEMFTGPAAGKVKGFHASNEKQMRMYIDMLKLTETAIAAWLCEAHKFIREAADADFKPRDVTKGLGDLRKSLQGPGFDLAEWKRNDNHKKGMGTAFLEPRSHAMIAACSETNRVPGSPKRPDEVGAAPKTKVSGSAARKRAASAIPKPGSSKVSKKSITSVATEGRADQNRQPEDGTTATNGVHRKSASGSSRTSEEAHRIVNGVKRSTRIEKMQKR